MTSQEEQETETAENLAQNCLFCKIINGEIPSKKMYEDPDFIGILDINPAAEGHVLLMTKKHYQIMPQLPQELVGNLGIAVKKISQMILKGFGSEGTSIFVANGFVAGQKAPHFMLHIIPRKDGDLIKLNPKIENIQDAEFETTKTLIKSFFHKGSQKKEIKETPAKNIEVKTDKKADYEHEKKKNPDDPKLTESKHIKKNQKVKNKSRELKEGKPDHPDLDKIASLFIKK